MFNQSLAWQNYAEIVDMYWKNNDEYDKERGLTY